RQLAPDESPFSMEPLSYTTPLFAPWPEIQHNITAILACDAAMTGRNSPSIERIFFPGASQHFLEKIIDRWLCIKGEPGAVERFRRGAAQVLSRWRPQAPRRRAPAMQAREPGS